eukprot:1485288-Rhodomonas_salina.1
MRALDVVDHAALRDEARYRPHLAPPPPVKHHCPPFFSTLHPRAAPARHFGTAHSSSSAHAPSVPRA